MTAFLFIVHSLHRSESVIWSLQIGSFSSLSFFSQLASTSLRFMRVVLLLVLIVNFLTKFITVIIVWRVPRMSNFMNQEVRRQPLIRFADKISRRLINKSSHTIYYQVAYKISTNFFCLLNHTSWNWFYIPLLSYNSWIQCPYHVRLELCNNAVFINQEMRR